MNFCKDRMCCAEDKAHRCYRDSIFYLHNDDGPAIDFFDGRKLYYIHGRLHREDGPAVVNLKNNSNIWYINDEEIS